MSLFAIGDLHMPGGDDKPMDVFGAHWENHVQRIFDSWRDRVRDGDTVLMPGDLSWAMQLKDAVPDLTAIGQLPGRKIICRGNHDYWWGSLKQLRAVLPQGMDPVQNAAVDVGEAVVCGTRGWMFPAGDETLSPEDERVLNRELIRLELALQDAVKLAGGAKPIVVMLHYPPLYDQVRETPFTALLAKYPVHTVVYGHLHGQAIHAGFSGCHEGVRYLLVSSDSLGFSLAEVPLEDGEVTEKLQNP